ncbi:MAG: 50S ribosomal protein L28 [bacterium]|nr:50S ribosomal protein L28 [bacterium]
MAKCAICGKKPVYGNNVSHSNLKTRRVWQPNTHKMRIIIDGKPARVNVCAQCIKSGKVQKAI